MNHIKSLAGQTAIYGVSSIIGRLINYLLVPLHTTLFAREAMGQVSYFYSAAALLLIVFTHGMETTFFRFANKESEKSYYNYAFTSVLLVSLVLSIILILGSDGIAVLADYEGDGKIIRWLALIILLDAVTAIPFARLRHENKAKRFAVTKLANIALNIVIQLVFLVIFPAIAKNESHVLHGLINNLYDSNLGVGYIFLANLLANGVLVFMLWPYFQSVRLQLNTSVLGNMMSYAMPLLFTGIAGWITQLLDRILVGDLLSKGELGVYDQTFKLAILIQLAVQAFRYAGEPFFFSKAKDQNAPEVFADVLYYFMIFSMIIFVGISFNIDWIAQIMLRRPEYRTVLYLVPIIMMGKLFYGAYINISIWYKIKDKTIYGTYFTLLGAIITIIGNLLLIPVLGLLGSALTVLFSYFVMTFACYIVGRRYFRVPYPLIPITLYLISGVIIVWASFYIKLANMTLDIGFNIGISFMYCLVIWFIERRNLTAKSY